MTLMQLASEYLKHKQALGNQYKSEGYILRAFCKHLEDCPTDGITLEHMQDLLHAGCSSADTVARKYSVIRGFSQYLSERHRIDLPILPMLPRNAVLSDFVPYIYSHEELACLIKAIEPTCQFGHILIEAHTVRAIVLVLYGAGLRRGEAFRLNRDDVDLDQAILTIRQTKFHKTRLVPIGKDLNNALIEYQQRDDLIHTHFSNSPFFHMRKGGRVEQFPLQRLWRRLCQHANVEREGGARNQPRLHDLRHTAAVHRLIAWYRSGVDLNKLLPMLATYLGHGSIAGTQRYLTLTPELLQEASQRFESYALGGCHE